MDAPQTPVNKSETPPSLTDRGFVRLRDALSTMEVLTQLETLPPTEQSDIPNTFGRFVIRSLLGRGRFGLVFLADDPVTGRSVALKLPQPGVLIEQELRSRFVREAHAASRLDHPGIVPILEAGEIGSVLYLVMMLVHGPTLADWLAKHARPIDSRDAAKLVAALAEAVQHAHERGVLHCDLKPGNVLLDPHEQNPVRLSSFQPRITDFGLARLHEEDPSLTHTHLFAGSLPYMAPEQSIGIRRDLTARCDVYALGVILFEMLTGQTPFQVDNYVDLRRQEVSYEPPDLGALRPDLPRDLEAIVLKCIERDPRNRYTGAADLAEDLRRFLEGKPTRVRPLNWAGQTARWVRRRPVLATLMGLTFLAFTAMLVVAAYLLRLQGELAAERELGALRDFHTLLSRVEQRRTAKPFGWSSDNLRDLQTLAAMSSSTKHLTELRSEAAEALAAVELRSGRILQEGFNAGHVAFSPDGKIVALAEQWPSGQTLRLQLRSTENGELLTELHYPVDLVWEREKHGNKWADGPGALAFSPDGRWLVTGTKSGWLVCWDLHNPKLESIRLHAHPYQDSPFGIEAVRFTEDGSVLATSTENIIRCRRVGDWQPLGAPVEGCLPNDGPPMHSVTPLLWANGKAGTFDFFRGGWITPTTPEGALVSRNALNRAGLGAVFEHNNLMLAALPDGKRLAPLTTSVRNSVSPRTTSLAFNPDGEYLLESSNQLGRLRLWDVASGRLLETRGGMPGRLRAAFHPNGRRLAITEGTRTQMYDLVSRGVRQTVCLQPRIIQAFDLTPDGRTAVTSVEGDLMVENGVLREFRFHTQQAGHSQLSRVIWRDASPQFRVALSQGGDLAFTAGSFQNGRSDLLWNVYPPFLKGVKVADLRFAPDGRLWAAIENKILVFSPGGRESGCFQAGSGKGLDFHSLDLGRELVAAGQQEGHVVLLDPTCKLLHRWNVFDTEGDLSVALSDDESHLLAGSREGDVRLMEVTSGRIVIDLPKAHQKQVTGVGFGPGGILITGSLDRTVKFWSAEGNHLLTLNEEGPVLQLRMSSGGSELTLLLENELALRRWNLGRLHSEFATIGIDPGFPKSSSIPSRVFPTHGVWATGHLGINDSVLWEGRIDQNINFNKKDSGPVGDVVNASIRWTGYLVPHRPGKYRIRIEADNDVRMWINGRLILEKMGHPGEKWREAEIDLPDHPVSLRVEYLQHSGSYLCRLFWKRADDLGPFRVVPWEVLYPDAESARKVSAGLSEVKKQPWPDVSPVR